MKKVLPDHVGIKASGGIKTYEQAMAMIEAGANRIGTSAGISILTPTNPHNINGPSIDNMFFQLKIDIPEPFRISETIEQREYLINGELKIWTGALNPVLSPVFLKQGNEFKQKVIGSTPLLTSKESLEALDAAVKAYDLGHGLWPTMSVTDRIEHVENFLESMRINTQ